MRNTLVNRYPLSLSDISIKESLPSRATSTGVVKEGFFQRKNLVKVVILGLQKPLFGMPTKISKKFSAGESGFLITYYKPAKIFKKQRSNPIL